MVKHVHDDGGEEEEWGSCQRGLELHEPSVARLDKPNLAAYAVKKRTHKLQLFGVLCPLLDKINWICDPHSN